jgi:MoaA/NifB/PqqE/SkfB family radical SAM enzyme
MYQFKDIRHVHLEISTRCNAACPSCPRNLCGVDILDDFPLHDMSLSEAKTIFTTEFLYQLENIHINGNLGDFVTARDGIAIIEYFLSVNPKLSISISTNAGIKSIGWTRLAELGVAIDFCIDGLAGTHELYRQQTRWETVIENAQTFIKAGGVARWKMIRFDHNQDEKDACGTLAKELGFENFVFVDHGRSDMPVFDQKGRFKHDIGVHNLPTQFEKILWIRTDGRQQEPIKVEHKKINCDAVKNRSVYITATGEVYPCCWLGFYPRTMYHQDNQTIKQLLPMNNNANDIGIESALQWFDEIKNTWDKNQLIPCATYCGS